MKACKDCHYCDISLCKHKKALRKLKDFVSGSVRDYYESCNMMRLTVCGEKAKLFKKKEVKSE